MKFIVTVIGPVAVSENVWRQWDQFIETSNFKKITVKTLSTRAREGVYDTVYPSLREVRARIRTFIDSYGGLSVCVQDYPRNKIRFAVFDLDSTLIMQEVIDLLARHAAAGNIDSKVSGITAAAMNGEIDFQESLRQRAALLKGTSADKFETIKSEITFTKGVRELIAILKEKGVKTAVISGGFIQIADWVKEELGLDYAFANSLEIDPETNTLTGKVLGNIIDAELKAKILVETAATEQIHLQSVVAVGDGANDLKMLRTAGLGIAFNAKATVEKASPIFLNSHTMQDILYYLGYSLERQEAILEDISL